jgi:hypothetical protein
MKFKRISRANIPDQWPLFHTITMWLWLDRLHVSAWVWGVFWSNVVLLWIASAILIFKFEYVDVLEEKS